MHKAENIYFLLIEKKNEMAQGRGWPKAGYLPLLRMDLENSSFGAQF